MSDPRQHFRISVNRRGFMHRNGATSLCTLVDLTTQGLQISAELPLLVGDRIEIECQLESESRIHCTLKLTHAAGRQGGGRVVDITPQHHRRLMDFLDRQNAAPHNNP
ncbi:MAG: PilZ domain-containing protein [Nitrospira sp.]|nr:PilZ domain-containing protein [Nitrospira sp.]